jgi:hypothetical protein
MVFSISVRVAIIRESASFAKMPKSPKVNSAGSRPAPIAPRAPGPVPPGRVAARLPATPGRATGAPLAHAGRDALFQGPARASGHLWRRPKTRLGARGTRACPRRALPSLRFHPPPARGPAPCCYRDDPGAPGARGGGPSLCWPEPSKSPAASASLSVPGPRQCSRSDASSRPHAPRCPGDGARAPGAPLTTIACGESLLTQITFYAIGAEHLGGGRGPLQEPMSHCAEVWLADAPAAHGLHGRAALQVRCRSYCPASSS